MPVNPYKGMSVVQMQVQKHLAPTGPSGIPHSTTEGRRNWNIQAHLNEKNFRGNDVTRVVLPKDDKHSQQMRDAEFFRQSAMPWGSQFMHTQMDATRLNNPSQAAFMRQKQLTPPSTYGQWYAFMHAMSAAFGTLQQGK